MSYDDVMITELLNENATAAIRLNDWEENFLTDMEEKTDGGLDLTDDEEIKVAEIYQRYIGG